MQTRALRPRLHVSYLIENILMTPKYANQWWVVWFESHTFHSAGMQSFESFAQAFAWTQENPPEAIEGEGDFDQYTIIFTGTGNHNA